MRRAPSRRRFVAALASLCASGCVGSERGPRAAPPRPTKLDPPQLIPPELDAVLRFDLERLRSGPAALAGGARAKLGAGSSDGSETLRRALERADTLWLGLRPSEARLMADAVWVLRGDFAAFSPGAAWGSPFDLGAGWELYERRPEERADPGRLYRQLDELCVFVSEAAYDSIERALEQGVSGATLVAPSYGLVSVRARAPALAERLSKNARAATDLLRRAVELYGVVDARGGFWTASVFVEFREKSDAEKTARAVELLAKALSERDARARLLLPALDVGVLETTLQAKLKVAEETLLSVIACWGSAECTG